MAEGNATVQERNLCADGKSKSQEKKATLKGRERALEVMEAWQDAEAY